MDFEVRILPDADDDLFEIYLYVAEHGGDERADIYDRRIRAACAKLASFPNRGTPREPLEPGLRSIPFERRATIYYRVTGRVVEIVRILGHGLDADPAFRP